MKTYECKICHIRFKVPKEKDIAEIVCENCGSDFIDEVVEVKK